jgi:hypothetical protein
MRQDRSAFPARTSRREVLLAAGSTLALRPSAVARSGEESYLALLLRRRAELERMVTALADAADRARPAPRDALSPATRKQLRSLRRAASRASQALERLEWVIADTPAETLDDVALKLRFYVELQGYGGEPAGWRAPFTVEEQLLRTIIADLKRLNTPTE